MRHRWRNSWKLALLVILAAVPAFAQLEVGENAKLNLNGDVSVGYGGSFTDAGASTHNVFLGGNGVFSGYYYSPKFISFSVNPSYNRNQDNSTFQLVNNNLGLFSQVEFFTGSHFPGNFSYNENHNSTSSLGLPGAGGLATNGSGRGWNLSWSALLPKWPTLTVSFTKAHGSADVYGTNEESSSATRTLSFRSTYSLAGFQMNGSYLNSAIGMDSPTFLVGQSDFTRTDTHSSSLIYSVNHRLPLRGFVIGSATRFHANSTFVNGGSDTTTHNYNASASIFPSSKLSLTGGTYYTDNLSGSLNQPFIEQGSGTVVQLGNGKVDSLSVYGGAGLALFRGFFINANANHVAQHWAGSAHSSTQFSGTATYNYMHRFLGSFTFSGGVVDTATHQGNTGAGLVGNVNFSRRLGHWEVGAGIGYSQTVQTFLDVYTTSSYIYNANVRRRFGNYYWSSFFSGVHSGLDVANRSSHSENVGMSVSTRRYSANALWGRSLGMSVLTSSGLVATPTNLPTAVLSPETIVVYNGSHYGFGGSTTLLQRMIVMGNYSNASNSTIAGLKSTFGETSMLNTTLRYPFRKMYFSAGYVRLGQTVSVAGAQPIVVRSYYFGISRWFNFF